MNADERRQRIDSLSERLGPLELTVVEGIVAHPTLHAEALRSSALDTVGKIPSRDTLLPDVVQHIFWWAAQAPSMDWTLDMTPDDVAALLVESAASIAEGETPVLFLSRGQQEALQNSDPPDPEMVAAQPSPFGPLIHVVLAQPLELIRQGASVTMMLFNDIEKGVALFSTIRPTADPTSPFNLIVFMEYGPDTDVSPETAEFVSAVRSIGYAARMFGLTDRAPAMTRAQHRQEERAAKRRTEGSKRIALRYLRDPHASIKPVMAREAGRHVRPHWRRGHWRRVWLGAHGSDERRAEARFIPPVLVNSHLGTPAPSVYRWQKGTP